MAPLKLRFAPSPTGYLHVGGARTAIFNLLHARRHGGVMVLRIEDTDVERSRQHHAEQIVDSLSWLGVEWDEGPFYQSDRRDRYRERARELVERGAAYRCYCSVEELESERAEAEAMNRQYRYSGRCREQGARDASDPHVIRFRVEPGPIRFKDLIRGDVEFDGDLIDDFVLLRSDGNPTYHLSVVVDDIDMGITLVARGEDHLSNTPKHVLLFDGFGATVPEFAHVSLILGPDKKRLSKRTGATSVEEYRTMGVLPEALFNFLLLLGWAPGANREVLSRADAEAEFELSAVHRSAAVFDLEKLLWLNHQYIQQRRPEDLAPLLEPFLDTPADPGSLPAVVAMLQPRARTLREMAEQAAPLFAADDSLAFDEEAVRKHIKGVEVSERLLALREAWAGLEPFDVAETERSLRGLAESSGISAAKYIHPLRLALTGRGASPPIFDVAAVLGKERVLARIDRLVAMIPGMLA